MGSSKPREEEEIISNGAFLQFALGIRKIVDTGVREFAMNG
jgi:hypothetical protein